jgi:hypothetical protein
VFQSTVTMTLQYTVCSSLQLTITVFQSTVTTTLEYTVCSSLQLLSQYSRQSVTVYSCNDTSGTPLVATRSLHLRLGVWANYL